MTLYKIFKRLRKQNQGQYLLLGFCISLSVLLVTAFALMYLSPSVQGLLPPGGDTRKMSVLLLWVTIIGCLIFTLYASGLFFRYKSREYGILLALGTPKKLLAPLLFQELFLVTAAAAVIGLLLAIPASFGIWKIFEFLIPSGNILYQFSIKGMLNGLIFCAALAVILFVYGFRFIKKTNIMDILREGQKTEMVKLVPSWTQKAGIILTAFGIFLALGVPQICVRLFHQGLPAVYNLVYLVVLAGIYLFLLSLVSQSSAGHHKKKYYKNLVSISMMRFSAKTATRNMCVTVLLLFCCLFSAFYGMLYCIQPEIGSTKNGKSFTLHFPVKEKQVTKSDIEQLAKDYQVTLTDYQEGTAANLVMSYRQTDLTDDNKYIILDMKKGKLGLFFPKSLYEKYSGQTVSLKDGTYKTITSVNYKENIWNFVDGLYEVMNPDTGKSFRLSYSGSVEFNAFTELSDPYAYVISDKDYETMTAGLKDEYLETVTAFDVKELSSSYPFAKALEREYVRHSSSLSDHRGLYDAWEDKLAQENGEAYTYEGSIGLSASLETAPDNWKYGPRFTIVIQQELMQKIAIYVILCLYIFIIMLTAVCIMSYVRGISIASENKTVFQSLQKLGAGPAYTQNILKKQLRNIFQYPAAIGCIVAFIYSVSMVTFNDFRITLNEMQALGQMAGLILIICIVLYAVYRMTYQKSMQVLKKD